MKLLTLLGGLFLLNNLQTIPINRTCDNITSIHFKNDSFLIIAPIILNKTIKIKNKFRNRIFVVKGINCEGDAEVEVYNYSKTLLSKGFYKKNELQSTEEVVYVDTKGNIIGAHSIFNVPCKDGDWLYLNKKGEIIKKEIWSCDSLLRVEK